MYRKVRYQFFRLLQSRILLYLLFLSIFESEGFFSNKFKQVHSLLPMFFDHKVIEIFHKADVFRKEFDSVKRTH
jgi:hypothetical protein